MRPAGVKGRLLLILGSSFMVVPLMWMITASFKPQWQIFANPIMWVPQHWEEVRAGTTNRMLPLWTVQVEEETRKVMQSGGRVSILFADAYQGGDNLGLVEGWDVPGPGYVNHTARIHNFGASRSVSITIRGPGGSEGRSAQIGPDGDYYLSFTAYPGVNEITLDGGDAIAWDNHAYIYVPDLAEKRVLYLGRPGPALAALRSLVDRFQLVSIVGPGGIGKSTVATALADALRNDFADGVSTYRYQITNIGNSLTLATFCHENGHMICFWPDLYDYGSVRGQCRRWDAYGICLACYGDLINGNGFLRGMEQTLVDLVTDEKL